MHITRERVRQIENGAVTLIKANIQKSPETAALIEEEIKKFIVAKGGVSKKSDVVKYAATLAPGIEESHIDFLAEASGVFNLYREDDAFPVVLLRYRQGPQERPFFRRRLNWLLEES